MVFDPTAVVKIGASVGFAPEIYPCIMGPGGYPTWNKKICPYPGIYYEYFVELCKFAGLKYEMVPLHNLTKFVWGSKNETTGKWDAMFGALQTGQVDTLSVNFVVTEPRAVDFDFGQVWPHQYLKLGFILREPESSFGLSGADMLYGMFQPMVWLSFGALTIMCLCLLLLAKYAFDFDVSRNSSKYMTPVWDTIAMMFDQTNGDHYETKYSIKSFALCAGFIVLFLHTLYEGYLVTMMLGSSTSGPFESMSELAALISKGQYKLISYSETDSFMSNIQKVDTPAWRTMKDALAKNPPVYVKDLSTMLDMIQQDGTLVLPGRYGIQAVAFLSNRCNLIFQPDKEAGSRVALGQMYNKGSELLTYLQPFHTKLGSGGGDTFVAQLLDKYIQHERMLDKCVRADLGKKGPQPLNITHYYGITIILLIGVGTAIIFLAFEYIYSKFYWPAYRNTRIIPRYEAPPSEFDQNVEIDGTSQELKGWEDEDDIKGEEPEGSEHERE